MTDLEVQIEWSEEVNYRSVITVDAAEVMDWLNEGAAQGKVTDPSQIKVKDVREFLRNGDDADWFEQCDPTKDFFSVDDRSLDDVRSLKVRNT
jgi:hypothetical protein